MLFTCPHCKQNVDAGPECAGLTVNCPHQKCGKQFLIPAQYFAREQQQPSASASTFDLRQLHLPRRLAEFDRKIQLPNGIPSITDRRGIEHIAKQLPDNTPFFAAGPSGALAIIRHPSLETGTSAAEAVRNNRVLCIPVFGIFPEYPVLCLKCAVYDNPPPDPNLAKLGILAVSQGPLLSDRVVDITSEHIQTFLEAILETGTGQFALCLGAGPNVQCAAIGQLSFRIPPPQMRPQAMSRAFSYRDQTFPYHTTSNDRTILWSALKEAATHLLTIPEPKRDFWKAFGAYIDKSMGW